VLLRHVVETSRAVAATSARREKVSRLADLLGGLDPAEVPAAVAFLSGELRQRQIGVGWAALRDAAPAAAPPASRPCASPTSTPRSMASARAPAPARRPSAGGCWPSCSGAPARTSAGSSPRCSPGTCARGRCRA
jgi:hypothetical protein